MIKVPFFTRAVQISQHHLLKRLFLLHFMLLLPLSNIHWLKTWVYFWALCWVPLAYVPVFMPVPGRFDYSDLVIQFDIRYCDPSCLVLLSQNCCSYLGSFMVPYKFLKCLFYMAWVGDQVSFFLHIAVQISQLHLLKRLFFLHFICSCLLCQILIDPEDWGLFLGSLFCSIGLCACFYASTRLFWLQGPCNTVWYQVLWYLLLCSSFSKLLQLFGVVYGSI